MLEPNGSQPVSIHPCLIQEIKEAMKPFIKMDRNGNKDLDEVACKRGTASDTTVITSKDFRNIHVAYLKLLQAVDIGFENNGMTLEIGRDDI
jgi:hypothetical protein